MRYNFSAQDAQTMSTHLNALYNVRCAPPLATSPDRPPQLLSLCQAATCPIAAPEADCAPYANLTAEGIAGENGAPVSSAASSATGAGATAMFTVTATPAAAATSAAPAGEAPLSVGAIAGIAIGAGAGAILAATAVALLILRYRARQSEQRSWGMGSSVVSSGAAMSPMMRQTEGGTSMGIFRA